MINLADDLAEHRGWGGQRVRVLHLTGILDRLTFIPPVGSRPQVGSAWFLSCLKSRGGIFFFFFFSFCLSFFFIFYFFGLESQPHLRLSVSVFNHLGPHSLGVHPGYSTDAEQDLRRSEVGRARKTSSGWSGRINHLLYPFFFFLPLFFFFLPLSSCLHGQCHQTGQMTPETRKLHAPRFLEKVSAHVCAWYEGLFGNGERWYRRESGGVASTAWWGEEGGRVLCASCVLTEEHRCISPWNPNPQMHRRTTAFINNIQTQLSWLEKQ